jgi:hypothetical protein
LIVSTYSDFVATGVLDVGLGTFWTFPDQRLRHGILNSVSLIGLAFGCIFGTALWQMFVLLALPARYFTACLIHALKKLFVGIIDHDRPWTAGTGFETFDSGIFEFLSESKSMEKLKGLEWKCSCELGIGKLGLAAGRVHTENLVNLVTKLGLGVSDAALLAEHMAIGALVHIGLWSARTTVSLRFTGRSSPKQHPHSTPLPAAISAASSASLAARMVSAARCVAGISVDLSKPSI